MGHIAIIPARSGSKGIKDKNIKELYGKPLIYWTIKAALESGQYSEIMVSTDSKEYQDIALRYGAKVPFLRSEKNSADVSSTRDAVLEVLNFYKEQGKEFDTVSILQPTSPLRTGEDIKKAFLVKQATSAKAIISVCELEYPKNIIGNLSNSLSFEGFCGLENDSKEDNLLKKVVARRQDSEKLYRINGAIYISDVDFYFEHENLYRNDTHAFAMKWSHSVDIDTEDDFDLAEYFMRKNSTNINNK